MAHVEWPIHWERLGRLSRTFIVRNTRGRLAAQVWPRPRGRKKLSPKQREQVEWFKQATILAKYAPPLDHFFRRIYTHGAIRNDRDLAISAMAGRLFPTLLIDGKRYYAVAIKQDISTNLDLFTETPGGLLVRAGTIWSGLTPGNEGQVLTMLEGTPSWKDPNGGGGPAVTLPQTYSVGVGLSSLHTQRALASCFKVHAPHKAARVTWMDQAGMPLDPRRGYLLQVSEPGTSFTVVAILCDAGTLTPDAGDGSDYHLEFPGPIDLSTGNFYAACLAIQRDSAPSAYWLKYNSIANIRTQWPVEQLNYRYGLDKTTIEVNDTFTALTGNVFCCWTG